MAHRSEVMHHEVDQALRRPCEFFLKRKGKPLMPFIQFSHGTPHTRIMIKGQLLIFHRIAAGYIPRGKHSACDSTRKLRRIKLSIGVGPVIGD
jgi:hypothetical protein